MRRALLFAMLIQGAAFPLLAQDASQQSRTELGEAIRAVLIDTRSLLAFLQEPEPIDADLYGEDAARDLEVLDRAADRLFSPDLPGFGPEGAPAAIAFFTRENCSNCDTAEAELREIAERLGLRVSRFDLLTETALATELGLDLAPSYVLPDMMLRGAMPGIVLEKYLTR